MNILRSTERGHFSNEWLTSFHTFSFGDYYNPNFINFRHLRVINHDFIAAGQGFATHPHRNMEIITYVLKGQVAHKDSMGNVTTINAGEIQVMTAGRGITHSEFNPSLENQTELLQIWITPNQNALTPGYGQMLVPWNKMSNHWHVIVSGDAQNGSLRINQDVRISATKLQKDNVLEVKGSKERFYWIQIASGRVKVQENTFNTGDAFYGDFNDPNISILGLSEVSEILFFDLN